jgi:hypothetical protein
VLGSLRVPTGALVALVVFTAGLALGSYLGLASPRWAALALPLFALMLPPLGWAAVLGHIRDRARGAPDREGP